MQSSQLNGFDEVFLITFNAYDVTDLAWLYMARVILEQLIA
jgi:hypothetical protein